MTSQTLATALEGFLGGSTGAVVVEDGAVVFDLQNAKYSVSGIDYWSRVAWHHRGGEFPKFGYFPRRELSPEPPVLVMAAPALHVHPATDIRLRYISPKIEWRLLGVDERWRKELYVVFRKHSTNTLEK